MFRRTKKYVKTSEVELDKFIEGCDYANSELLYKLDKVTEYSKYIITKYEHRIDLIASDIYGDSAYSWILLYVNRIDVSELVRGVELKYIPKATLHSIINNV